jgi:hypothetical protein
VVCKVKTDAYFLVFHHLDYRSLLRLIFENFLEVEFTQIKVIAGPVHGKSDGVVVSGVMTTA